MRAYQSVLMMYALSPVLPMNGVCLQQQIVSDKYLSQDGREEGSAHASSGHSIEALTRFSMTESFTEAKN